MPIGKSREERRSCLGLPFGDAVGDVAEDLLSVCWDRHLPVDPFHVAHLAGFRCLPDRRIGQASGYIRDCETGRFVILYSPVADPMLMRFAIAHAIGHHVLYHGTCLSASSPVRSLLAPVSEADEMDARRFAMHLLMPKPAILDILRRGANSTNLFRRIFDVPVPVIRERIRGLHEDGHFVLLESANDGDARPRAA